MQTIRIGTRGSLLARTQTGEVAAALAGAGIAVEVVHVLTLGDTARDARFSELGPGVFTRALDEALIEGRIDCAVHSAKDLPTEFSPAIEISAFLARHFPHDALILADGYRKLVDVPAGAAIGTSSARRRALLRHARPDLALVEMRGNVHTRLAKLARGGMAGTLLARAGLERLGLGGRVTEVLDPHTFVPAPGQGALAVTSLRGGGFAAVLRELLDDRDSRSAVTAEREFLACLGGGCQVPAGACAAVSGDRLAMDAVLLSTDGRACLRARVCGAREQARELGAQAAGEIIQAGGAAIVAEARS